MKTVYEKICEDVGIFVIGNDLAKIAVMELLQCIGRKPNYAERYPEMAANEITEYLDSFMVNP